MRLRIKAKLKRPVEETGPVITEIQLIEYKTREARVADLKDQLKRAEADLTSSESEIMGLVRQGAKVLSDTFSAVITQVRGKCTPSWKTWYLDLKERLGTKREAAEAEVMAQTKVEVKDKLVVGFRRNRLLERLQK
jgi:phosphoribosyl-dephospho-CoA transferase